MKAVVLAGGKGTRLRPLTYTKPKPLLPLAGEPAIGYLIKRLSREGFKEIILTTNYFADHLRAALGDGSTYGVRIEHVEEKAPLGTAGSVKNSEALVNETFAVVQGDNQFEFDLSEVFRSHKKLGALATLALVQVEDPSGYGIAELTNGHVTRYLEKPKPKDCFSNLINAGFYILEPEVLKLVPEGEMFDFSKGLFPLMLRSRMTLGGCRVDGFWVDIGDSQSYLKASMWALDKLAQEEAAGKIADSESSIPESVVLRRPVYVGKNVKVENSAVIGPYACIGDGSEILRNARISSSVIYESTRIGSSSVLDTCVVAENCKIGDHVQIERNVIIGAATELGDKSRVVAQSKVGPWSIVEPCASVEGTITPFENGIDQVSEILERSHIGTGLTREEARICWALCKLDVSDAKAIGCLLGVPEQRTDLTLSALQERGIVRSLRHEPKMFTLAR